MKENTSEQRREWENEAKEFLRNNYPPKNVWVDRNLEVLNGFLERKSPMSEKEAVDYAIQTTEGFARNSGIGLRPESETDVLHIPSRLEAIRKFEKDTQPLYKQLTLDKIIRIFILAEAASVQRSIGYTWSDVAQEHLNKLTELVRIHKDLTGL
jgi:hypothetical protein